MRVLESIAVIIVQNLVKASEISTATDATPGPRRGWMGSAVSNAPDSRFNYKKKKTEDMIRVLR